LDAVNAPQNSNVVHNCETADVQRTCKAKGLPAH